MSEDTFNLKDKIYNSAREEENVISIEDVKEFISRETFLLNLVNKGELSWANFWIERYKLTGDLE